jgi:hypothetical protein
VEQFFEGTERMTFQLAINLRRGVGSAGMREFASKRIFVMPALAECV